MQKALLPRTDPLRKLPPSTSLFSLKGITHIFLHYKGLNLCIVPASFKLSSAATDKGCSEIKICDSYKYIMKQLAKHYKNSIPTDRIQELKSL